MRLSRANIPLASEDRTHSQAISPSPHYNLAPHFWPGFINLQHFCHSRWRNPVRLSKSGVSGAVEKVGSERGVRWKLREKGAWIGYLIEVGCCIEWNKFYSFSFEESGGTF